MGATRTVALSYLDKDMRVRRRINVRRSAKERYYYHRPFAFATSPIRLRLSVCGAVYRLKKNFRYKKAYAAEDELLKKYFQQAISYNEIQILLFKPRY